MYTNHDMVTGAWRTAKGWCGTAVGGVDDGESCGGVGRRRHGGGGAESGGGGGLISRFTNLPKSSDLRIPSLE